MRELDTKQVCTFPFIVYNKVCIVTIITSDVSGVTVLQNYDKYVYLNLLKISSY